LIHAYKTHGLTDCFLLTFYFHDEQSTDQEPERD